MRLFEAVYMMEQVIKRNKDTDEQVAGAVKLGLEALQKQMDIAGSLDADIDYDPDDQRIDFLIPELQKDFI